MKAGKSKKEYKLSMISDSTFEKVQSLAEARIESVFTDSSYGKVLNMVIAGFLNLTTCADTR